MSGLPSSLPYRVDRELGRGGMGVVYLAKDTRLGRMVAIKTITPGTGPEALSPAEQNKRIERLRREAQVLASLNHPGIAAIYDIAEEEQSLFLVMEYVDGPTVTDRLQQSPRGMSAPDALRAAAEIALAINAAHEAGVIHGDLKPANIKFTPKGAVKILDFGLARGRARDPSAMGVNPDDMPTQSFAPADIDSLVGGTPGYMSPEMARGQPVDARADLFALGCVLYEMLTGRKAFPGKTPGDAMAATLLQEPEYAALPAGLPDSVHRVLTRCLSKDAAKRPASAAEVYQSLMRAAGLAAASAAAATVPGAGGGGGAAVAPSAGAAQSSIAPVMMSPVEAEDNAEAEDVVPLADLAPGSEGTGARTFSQLPAETRDALVSLAPIAGTFSLATANAMLGAAAGAGGAGGAGPMLGTLVDQGLLTGERSSADSTQRYGVPPALRAHLLQRFRQSEALAGAYQRLLRHLSAWSAQVRALLSSPAQASALEQIEQEIDAIAGAVAWCQATGECAEEGVLLVSNLREYWEVRGRVGYARTALEKSLDRGHGRLSPHAEAMGFSTAGVLAYHEADMAEAVTLQRKALAMRRKIQDEALIADSLLLLGEALVLKEPLTARKMLQEAIDIGNKLDRRDFVARSCLGLSLLSLVTASVIESQRALLASSYAGGGGGNGPSLAGAVAPRLDAEVRQQWAYLKLLQNELPEAMRLAKDAMGLRKQIGDQPGLGGALCLLAQIHLHAKEPEKAEALLDEGLGMLRLVRDKLGVMRGLCVKAHLLSAQGRHSDAVALWQACDRHRTEWMLPISPAERLLSERWLVHSVQAIGPDKFKQAETLGAAMTWLQMNE